MSRRPLLIALSLALAVAPLAACADSTQIPPAGPSASADPLFATDEEALAAATAAYEEFLSVSGQILRDGGADPERLRPLVSEEVYASEAEGFATLVSNDWRATGQSTLLDTALQQHSSGPEPFVEVVVYVCVGVAGTDVIDISGVSQIDPTRPTSLGFEVVFTAKQNGSLVVDRKEIWDGAAEC